MARTRQAHLRSVAQHCSLIGPIQTAQYRRERALARAVLAEQGVHFARGKIEIDIVIGKHSGKALRHASCRECEKGRTA
jgi:hypothetical protein